jgi:RHS repeat-associated protein
VKTTGPDGSVSYFFGDGTAERNGVREHDVTVGDRVIARVAMPLATVPGAVAPGAAAGLTFSAQADASWWRMAAVLVGLLAFLLAWLRSAIHLGAAGLTYRAVGARACAVVLVGAHLASLSCSSPSLRAGSQTLVDQATVTYLHTGFGVGPVVFTNAAGNLLEERRTEPFGESIDARTLTPAGYVVGDPDLLARDLNSLNKRTDVATGWSDHGARWMAPETARWLTPDPPVTGPDAGFMDAPWALHPYQYVDQNPVVYWDPDGRQPVPKIYAVRSYAAAAAEYEFDTASAAAVVGVAGAATLVGAVCPECAIVFPLIFAKDEGDVGAAMIAGGCGAVACRAAGRALAAESGELGLLKPAGAGSRRLVEPAEPSRVGLSGSAAGGAGRPAYVPTGPDARPLPLPRGPNGTLAPSSTDPHTQIGWQEGRRGGYVQTREFGPNGQPVKEVDWTNHGRPAQHTDPHVHDYVPNPTGGTPQHGPARPPRPGEL